MVGKLVSLGNHTDEQGRIINEVIGLISYHYIDFVIEDELFRTLREHIKKLVEDLREEYNQKCFHVNDTFECQKYIENFLDDLDNVFYATSSEPIRLGAFRVLLHEVYICIHGTLHFKPVSEVDLALHGVLKERLSQDRMHLGDDLMVSPWDNLSKEAIPEREFHVGIDYVSLVEYPAQNSESTVVVPLFVIAKSNPAHIREIEIKEAINESIQYDTISKNVEYALRNMLSFTRIVLTRTEIKEDYKCKNNKYLDKIGVPVYNDFACGILGIIFQDIPELYENVVNDKKLSSLTLDDWMEALLSLAVPITQIVTASSSSPPKPPGYGGVSIDRLVKQIRQKAIKQIGGEITEELYTISKNYINRVEPKLRQRLSGIINRYQEKRNHQESRRRLLNVG